MQKRNVTPTALERTVQSDTTPTASNKITKPFAVSPLLGRRERIGAKVIVQKATPAANVPPTLKSDAISSVGKKAEKTGAGAAKSFEARKDGVGARSERKDKKPHVKFTSPQKIAANRRNSKRSTGPKTQEGKSHSRWNSHKHGILANALLVTDGPAAENVAEFK